MSHNEKFEFKLCEVTLNTTNAQKHLSAAEYQNEYIIFNIVIFKKDANNSRRHCTSLKQLFTHLKLKSLKCRDILLLFHVESRS